MLENKFVDEYKKIKPSDELKTRIFYSVLEAEAKREKRPLYLRLRPVLSGALACVVLLCCMAVIPFEHLEEGDVSVFYAQSGEFIAPSHPMGRSYGIALCDDTYYEYAQMPNGCTGAEFTFEFGGKTQLKTDFGSIYQKNADGSYSELGEKTRLDLDGMFVAIGQVPENEPFKNVATLSDRGYIVSDENCLTGTEGLFTAGDCRTKNIRQIATACGDGAVAALAACRYLDK